MLIGVHFPKAGGTSTLECLRSVFGDRLFADYNDGPARVESPISFDPERYFARNYEVPSGIDCVYGHFHVNKYRQVKHAERFVILRHPVETIISMYHYYQSLPKGTGGTLLRYCVDNNLSVAEIARIPTYRYLMSRTYFGNVDMEIFQLIGRHDCRENTIDLLSQIVGVKLDSNLHLNLTNAKRDGNSLLDDMGCRAELSVILEEDIAFYNKFAYRGV